MPARSNRWRCAVGILGAILWVATVAAAAPDVDAAGLANPDAATRANAAARIIHTGQCSPEALDLLIARLADYASVRKTHLAYPTSAPAAATTNEVTVGDLAAEAVARLGARTVPRLIEALANPTCADAHGRIVNLLGQIDPQRGGEPVLQYVKRHVAARRRWDASISVAWVGPDVTAPLMQALDTDVLELQVVAARDLGDLGDGRAYAPLLAVTRRLVPVAQTMPTDYKIRRKIVLFRTAVPSVAKLGGPKAFDQIRQWQTLLSPCWDPTTTEALILAVAYTGDPRSAAVLIDLLQSSSTQGRRAAAEGLILLGEAAIDPLIERLADTNDDVRLATAEALRRITGVDHGDTQAAWRRWRTQPTTQPAATRPANN